MADNIPYIGVKIEQKNPLVCIFEPINKDVKFYERNLLNETLNAFNTWEEKLTYKTGGNWNIDTKVIKAEDHVDKDVDAFPECNTYLIFNQYDDSPRLLGSTSFDHSKSTHKYQFINIITDKKGFKLVMQPNSTDTEIKAKLEYFSKQLDTGVIGQVIKHEFGHALGLDHYYRTSLKILKYPSIMMASLDDTKFNPKIDITDHDIDAIVALYGEDGFGGNSPAKPKLFDIGKPFKGDK